MKELEEKDRTIQNSVQRVAYRKSKQGIDAIQYIHRDRKSFVFFFLFRRVTSELILCSCFLTDVSG